MLGKLWAFELDWNGKQAWLIAMRSKCGGGYGSFWSREDTQVIFGSLGRNSSIHWSGPTVQCSALCLSEMPSACLSAALLILITEASGCIWMKGTQVQAPFLCLSFAQQQGGNGTFVHAWPAQLRDSTFQMMHVMSLQEAPAPRHTVGRWPSLAVECRT